jgi:hypothetical protein
MLDFFETVRSFYKDATFCDVDVVAYSHEGCRERAQCPSLVSIL